MKLTKVVLAALAALIATLLIGPSSAHAVREVVLCKQLVEAGKQCPSGESWPSGSVISALASHGVLSAVSLEILCPDSLLEAKTTTTTNAPLPIEITNLVFASLGNSLGKGCAYSTCDEIHTKTSTGGTYPASITVTGTDEFHFTSSGTAQFLHCFGITCEYGSELILSKPITHNGTHPLHEGNNLPKITIEQELSKTSGGFLCPSKGAWKTSYVLYLMQYENEGKKELGLGWPALGDVLPNEIVLCKKLTSAGELCPTGSAYPSGTKLLALAANSEFKASPFSAVKCEDSVITAETTAEMGVSLGIKVTKFEFGKLPTPTLGSGCTTCTEGIHTPTSRSGSIEVSGEDDFALAWSAAMEMLNCFGLAATCVYGSDTLESLIDNDAGKHKLAIEEKGLAEILVSATLSYVKGSNFCPEKGTWTANYVVYALESEGKQVQGWISLALHL